MRHSGSDPNRYVRTNVIYTPAADKDRFEVINSPDNRANKNNIVSTPIAAKEGSEVREASRSSATASTAASSPGSAEGNRFDRDLTFVFDWDDTILPTSWLQRSQMLSMTANLHPEMQRQVAKLCAACTTTFNMAAALGTVILITNSAPGWVAESCDLFMPAISHWVKPIPVWAKPMHVPMTFKITTFQKECKNIRNLVSIGDGNTERIATLSLRDVGHGGEDSGSEARRLKSLKLIEMPTCQELIAQHEVLQAKLADIACFPGSLDLKARFVQEAAFGLRMCNLVHIGGQEAGKSLGFGAGQDNVFTGSNGNHGAVGSTAGARMAANNALNPRAQATTGTGAQPVRNAAARTLPKLGVLRGRPSPSSRRTGGEPGDAAADHQPVQRRLLLLDGSDVAGFQTVQRRRPNTAQEADAEARLETPRSLHGADPTATSAAAAAADEPDKTPRSSHGADPTATSAAAAAADEPDKATSAGTVSGPEPSFRPSTSKGTVTALLKARREGSTVRKRPAMPTGGTSR